MSEEFNFEENIRDVIEFEMLLPHRYREELEVLILLNYKCFQILRETHYRNVFFSISDFKTIRGFKYLLVSNIEELKFKPVLQRKELK